MKLIVGLGNPGSEYSATRHNIGFMAIDAIADTTGNKVCKKAFKSVLCNTTVEGTRIILVKPQTYMNLSGEAVSAVAAYYKLEPADIIVIHDDMDIDFGHIRIKKQGGSAGHRGISSIIKYLKENNFLRIRAGIGKPADNLPPAEYVLQRFSSYEQDTLKGVISNIEQSVKTILRHGPEKAMHIFHSMSTKTEEKPDSKQNKIN